MQPTTNVRPLPAPFQSGYYGLAPFWAVDIDLPDAGPAPFTIELHAATADLAASLAWSRLRRIVNLEPIEGAPIGEGDQ